LGWHRSRPELADPLFEAAEQELAVIIAELRELGHGRYPPMLAQQGLATAITGIAHSCPIPMKVVQLPASRLPDATEATAYYVLAEAVANVQKHARATSIRLHAAIASRLSAALSRSTRSSATGRAWPPRSRSIRRFRAAESEPLNRLIRSG
jgi:signal transduction histidine kinase